MRTTAAAVAALLLLSAFVAPASAARAADDGRTCFPPGGHRFVIGTEGPQIGIVVHTSLLTSLGRPGALGMEAVGAIDGEPIIVLRTGVLFEGVGDPFGFFAEPFSRFSIAFHYEFRLPMFGSDYDYESNESPVLGPVGTRGC
jgi:hypothetical protein